nr:sugar ABC transporter permease [Tessaracoccus coleopterorum]
MAAVPALVAAWLVIYPVAYNLWTSLHVNRLSTNDGEFVGLQIYRQLFEFGNLGGTIWVTLVWTVSGLAFQAVLGLILALALDRPGRGIGFIRTLLIAPWVMPGVVVSAVWLTIYNPIGGLANEVLSWFGLPGHDWLGDPNTALGALVFTNVWKAVPFWMLMLSAGLKAIPTELYEAAALDGAGYLKRVRHIVLPALKNVFILTGLLAFIWTFNYFDLSYAMTQGGPGTSTTTLAFDIYKTSFVFNRFDQGSALSVISFLLMSVAIVVYVLAARRKQS